VKEINCPGCDTKLATIEDGGIVFERGAGNHIYPSLDIVTIPLRCTSCYKRYNHIEPLESFINQDKRTI